MVEVISESREVTARKEHECSECCGTIAKGEKYLTATLKYDDVYQWKQHINCADFAKKHGDQFMDCDTGRAPIWDWEGGYLSDEVERERREILRAAGFKFSGE